MAKATSINHGRPARARPARRVRRDPSRRAQGFTLVELLTVIFIISLLIGILIPSVNAARNAAKKAATATTLDAIKVGLEMFRNDNETDFRATNGYPPSFSHPKISSGYTFDASLGQFPFLDPNSNGSPPLAYGAHWLPAMLMGADFRGYVKKSNVPRAARDKPWCWYPDPTSTSCRIPPIERSPFYLDPGNTRTRPTDELPGRRPTSRAFFTGWNWDGGNPQRESRLPVIVDNFGFPVLYYVANKHGRGTNMVEDLHNPPGTAYTGGTQQEGVPYYFHQDNDGFTGRTDDSDDVANLGWDFGGRPAAHAIGLSGADLAPEDIVNDVNRNTFARYIIGRKLFGTLGVAPAPTTPLRPVNHDSYLLITAGPDARFGTGDDVTNLPPFPD